MAKIKFENWKENLEIIKLSNIYVIRNLKWWKTISQHGKSKGKVECPCCNAITEIYVWSFIGCGKRCSNCNVLLSHGGAYVNFSETKNNKIFDLN